MKLHFEPNLPEQSAAIEAVAALFRGQEICRTEFTVTMRPPLSMPTDDLFPDSTPQQFQLGLSESSLGIGNRLTLLDDEILANLRDIQLTNGLRPPMSSRPVILPSRWRLAQVKPTCTCARFSS